MPETKSVNSNRSRAFFLLLFLIFVIYLIFTNLDTFGNLLLVGLGFGAVIIIHEFGHFIVAKLSGINVEAFSIGFSPVLAGIRKTEQGWRVRILPQFFAEEGKENSDGTLTFTFGGPQKPGETEYRIGLIPFGGFVKMLGQEDVGSVEATNDPRSFMNKSLLTRFVVVAAGVIFNALSAIIIFMIAFLIGVKLPAPVVGDVMPDSPAAKAGVQPGDKVLAVNGKTDIDFTNIALAAALSDVNEPVWLKVRHENGTVENVSLVARYLQGMPAQQPRSFGIVQAQSLTIAKVVDPNAEFKKLGLHSGDTIVAVNGKHMNGIWDLARTLKHTRAEKVELTVTRTLTQGSKSITVQKNITVPLEPAINPGDVSQVVSMVPRLQIIAVPATNPIENLLSEIGMVKKINRLEVNDIILSVNDVNYPTYDELRAVVTAYSGKELPIRVLRTNEQGKQEIIALTAKPKRNENTNDVAIGIGLALDTGQSVVARTMADKSSVPRLDIPDGARITCVGGKKVSDWPAIVRILWGNLGKDVTIAYTTQSGKTGSTMLRVPSDPNLIANGSGFAVAIPFNDLRQTYKADGPGEAIAMGCDRTIMFIAQTYITLKGLIVGLISPKALMGPAGILKVSYTIVSERMWTFYLYFIGLISASIAVINFLPFPVLDGGVATLMIIEKIKGSPISPRIQSAIAYTGLVLIIAFFLYVTWNDLTGVLFR